MPILARILGILNALLAPANNAAARHDPDRDRAMLVQTLRSRMSNDRAKDWAAED